MIELEASGWGTQVRAVAKAKGVPWERVERAPRAASARSQDLLDHLGASSLRRG